MNTKLERIQNWAELARQANWSVKKLSKLSGVSGETLRQHFHRQMGKSPGAWLAERRQQQALDLLRDGSTVKETAACLGYKQQTNFTRKFKEHWGICPSLKPPTNSVCGRSLRK
jgi:AraC-like DNA-binding protein